MVANHGAVRVGEHRTMVGYCDIFGQPESVILCLRVDNASKRRGASLVPSKMVLDTSRVASGCDVRFT
jgi:hypothetical protein